MLQELNGSKIDTYKNSVKCGFCQTLWGLEHFDTDIFTCKKCGTDVVEFVRELMPIRDTIRIIDKVFKK